MNPIVKRHLLFLLGCIPVRLGFAALARFQPRYLPLMGGIALLPAAAFLVLFSTGWRTTGPEVFGDRIWWNALRPLHAILLAIFAYLALRRSPSAWKVLLFDAMLGLVAFLVHHHVEPLRWGVHRAPLLPSVRCSDVRFNAPQAVQVVRGLSRAH